MSHPKIAPLLAGFALLMGMAAARDWPEPGGGQGNGSVSTSVKAPLSAPAEMWRVKYDDVIGEPAISDGTAYAVVRRKGSFRLIAIDVRTGREFAWTSIDAVGFAHVSVLGRTLVVVTQNAMHVYVTSGNDLVHARSILGAYRTPATLVPSIAAVFDRGEMKLVDVRTGEALYAAPAVPAKPAAILGDDDSATVYFQKPAGLDEQLETVAVRVDAARTATPTISASVFSDQFVPFSENAQDAGIVLLEGGESPRFLAAGPYQMRTLGDGPASYFFVPAQTDEPLIASDPVVWNGALYGRGPTGAIVVRESTGETRHVFTRQRQEPGAVEGPLTCASGVLVLGNYAVDAVSSRLLWTLPGLEFEGALIPAADGVLVYRDGAGAIVALSDDPAVVAAAEEKAAERRVAEAKEKKRRDAAAARARELQRKKAAAAKSKASSVEVEERPSERPKRKPAAKERVAKADPKTNQRSKARPKAQPKPKAKPKPKPKPKVKAQPKAQPEPRVKESAPREASPAEPAASVLTATMPGSGPGVVLLDGTRLAGAVERREDGSLRITARAGITFDVQETRVSAIESEAGLDVIGEPYGLVLATRAALDEQLRNDLALVCEQYAASGLDAEARRLVVELRQRDVDAPRVAAIEAALATPRDERRASKLPDEVGVRKAALRRLIAAANWLAGASLPLEASAVLGDAARIWRIGFIPEDANALIFEAAKPLVPASFPWAKRSSAAERWLAWAPHLAPAGAWFAREDETPALGASGSVWTRRTYVIRTGNLVLVTRSSDPLDLGPLLSRGEATVRALDLLLSNPRRGLEDPLEIRLHRSRDEFIEEDLVEGFGLDARVLGTYLDEQRSSRFFVPEAGALVDGGRSLADVMARVLVRQYIAERWRDVADAGLPSPRMPGYWLESGFARFVADQRIDMGSGSWRIDDVAARSLEATRELAAQRKLIAFPTFLDLTRTGYDGLGDRARTTIELGETRLPVSLSEQAIFDEQAGALVFYLLNGAGGDLATRYTRMFRTHFRDGTDEGAWSELGFETAEELQASFEAYLDALVPRE